MFVSFFQNSIAFLERNWTNAEKCCRNILTTMGRLGPSLLWRLDFNNFKEHYFFSALWKTRIFIILASFKYSSKLWHNIREDEIVCPNHVTWLPSKGIHMTFVVRLFIVILKKSCCMWSVEPKRIYNIKPSTTPSFGKCMWTLVN